MIEVVFEHPDFVVALKEAGVNFHSDEHGAGFVAQLSSQLNTSLFPVHRLDKVTSGLIILPKSSEAAAQFTQLFSERRVDKFYLALISDKPKKKQGWIKGDMAKSRRGAFKLLKSQDNPAVTRFYSYSLAANIRGVVLKPLSGKTHQLRVALKSLGSPIMGDTLYGASQQDRTYLHAYALAFEFKGENYQFCVPPEPCRHSQYFESLISQVTEPWLLPW